MSAVDVNERSSGDRARSSTESTISVRVVGWNRPATMQCVWAACPACRDSRGKRERRVSVGDEDEGSEHLTVIPVVIDARRKDSASKLKASPEASDDPHRPDSIQDEDVEQDAAPGSRDYPHGADATPACFVRFGVARGTEVVLPVHPCMGLGSTAINNVDILRRGPLMSFPDAVRICLRKYADFNGRARRSEYWFFFLFTAIVGVVGGILDAIFRTRSGMYGGTGPIQGILQLALLIPGLAVGARRLHDTGRSGWWLLIGLIPLVGWIILLVFFVQDSKPANQHGPNPKGLGEGHGAGYSETPPPSPQQY
jgi:uncharacterized membrane protein YhaH (DUF805 family)